MSTCPSGTEVRGTSADLVEEFWDLPLIETFGRQERRTSPNDFRDAFHQLFERRGQLLLTGSARQALQVLLAHAAAGSRRRRVLLSSFNCRAVAEAVRRAGLAIDTFDLATPRGGIDWVVVGSELTDQHLAVVIPHFFGIPTDFTGIIPAARRSGALIIEDCAHALGASIGGTLAGLLGDAAVFSFNYDKPISLAGGGALLINHPAIKIDRNAVEACPSRRQELRQFQRMTATLVRGRKRSGRRSLLMRVGARYHIPPYAPPALPAGIGSLRAAAGIWQLERYDEIRRRRNHHAQILNESLGHLSWYTPATVEAAYLKLRITVSQADAASAVRQCRQKGIAVGNSNWPRLIEPDGVASRPINAQCAATFGLDIPVHQNLSHADLQGIAAALVHARAPSCRVRDDFAQG